MVPARITRYMDFGKFVAMLGDSGLFFASYDCLGDPHEGKLGPSDRQAVTDEARRKYPKKHPNEAFLLWERDQWRSRLLRVGISCWYSGDVESVAMWHGYGLGVAIESTRQRILESLGQFGVEAHAVDYSSYEDRPVTGPDAIKVLRYKRPPFSHESEIRFFIHLDDDQYEALKILRQFERPKKFIFAGPDTIIRSSGIILHADLKPLVQSVIIAPDAPAWLQDAVLSVWTKYGYDHTLVHWSALEQDPYQGLVSEMNPPRSLSETSS